MLTKTRAGWRGAPFGFGMGFALAMIGFADFNEVNRMFTLRDLRMLFTFAGGVAVAAIGFLVVVRTRPRREPIHKGVVPGSVLFGIGWAISGGCPVIPLVQLGSGYLPALVTIAGLVAGMRLFRIVNGRWLRIDGGSCSV
jgi:uncharacterized membrane protein YedE/YeeE